MRATLADLETCSMTARCAGIVGTVDFVYIGGYTRGAGGDGQGITLARRSADGGLVDPRLVAVTAAPSFLVRHPDRPVLYAVNEVGDGELSAFAIGADGDLVPLGQWSTGGAEPCHLVYSDGHIYVANYGSGTVAVFPLDEGGTPRDRSALDGHHGRRPDEVGDPQRQEGPHAHMVVPVQGGVLVVDLGVDAVTKYAVDAGRLGPGAVVARLPAGLGPRHLAVVDGLVHVVCELVPTVVSYDTTEPGRWREVGRVPASARAGQAQPSEIAASADGRFLYVGNRGVDTIAVFELASGLPAPIGEVPCGGAWPRHFALDGDLMYVANERSHTVVTLRRDPGTGIPAPTGPALGVPSPTCVLV
jgi:6-phosphogluconolactonase (cycloisomerase 2 family)